MMLAGNTVFDQSKTDQLFLSPLDFKLPVYQLDTVEHYRSGKFFLGYSSHTIQYLISNLNKNQVNPVIVVKPSRLSNNKKVAFKGINLIQLSSYQDIAYWDTLLNYGRPVFAIANIDSGYSTNLVAATSQKAEDILKALTNGQNLMVVSDKNLSDSTLHKIPVIRNISWQHGTINLDLSAPGEISLITSGFNLDTISQSLHLRLINQDWARFKVVFSEDNITYISNPIFKYDGNAIKPPTIKANNYKSIFYNLAWLISIVLCNLLVNKFRRTLIRKKVEKQ